MARLHGRKTVPAELKGVGDYLRKWSQTATTQAHNLVKYGNILILKRNLISGRLEETLFMMLPFKLDLMHLIYIMIFKYYLNYQISYHIFCGYGPSWHSVHQCIGRVLFRDFCDMLTLLVLWRPLLAVGRPHCWLAGSVSSLQCAPIVSLLSSWRSDCALSLHTNLSLALPVMLLR